LSNEVEVKKKLLMLMVMVTVVGQVLAFDPPRIIGHLTASQPSLDDFATDFVCVGDQNGDGYDDLLVNHGIWDNGYGDQPFSNRVELFYGGRQMDDRPDFVIEGGPTGPIHFGYHINFLGRLTDSENPWWAVQILDESELNNEHSMVILYEAGDALDNRAEYVLRYGNYHEWPFEQGVFMGLGRRTKPMDVNGDGFQDIILCRSFDPDLDLNSSNVEIYYGGADFDTLPDVKFIIPTGNEKSFDVSSGYDVNNDGYDDMLIRYTDSRTEDRKLLYSLFLGGNSFDTTAVWEFFEDRYEDTLTERGFAMVPDFNGDHFDDWVIHYWKASSILQPTYREGYFLFYGGDEPNSVPDLRLDGAPSAWGFESEVVGGDINGDGYGDIICANPAGYLADGAIQVFFGARWYSNRNSLVVNGIRTYGAQVNSSFASLIGGVGEFNGDGTSDFVTRTSERDGPLGCFVFSKAENWEVSVNPNVISETYEFSLSSSPNPFNDRVTIQYSLSTALKHHLAIYDVNGRLIEVLVDDQQPIRLTGRQALVSISFHWLLVRLMVRQPKLLGRSSRCAEGIKAVD